MNFKTAGAVLKQNVNKMKQALAELSAEDMKACVTAFDKGEKITVSGFEGEFDTSLFVREAKTKEGIVAAEFAEDCVLALDITLTEELLADGAVRDLVRQCQLLRKEAGYSVEQKVVVLIRAEDDFIASAVKAKAQHIASELLAETLLLDGSLEADLEKTVDVADKPVVISVKKA